MRRYETIFIIRPNLGEDEIASIIDKANSIITGDGGTIIKIDKWGLKKLAYLIKKENQGIYVYIDYAGKPETVEEIERVSKIDDRLLKYMTVKLADTCDPAAALEELAQKATEAEQESEEDTITDEKKESQTNAEAKAEVNADADTDAEE